MFSWGIAVRASWVDQILSFLRKSSWFMCQDYIILKILFCPLGKFI